MADLRCDHKMFGELSDGLIVVKCPSSFCRNGEAGIVVLHRFDCLTGELVDTQRFRDPGPDPMKEGRTHATDNHPASVRTPGR